MKNKQGFSSITLIIIAVLILGGGYWVWKDKTASPTPAPVTDTNPPDRRAGIEPPAPSTPSVDMTDWKTYRNDEYGFELRYPGELIQEVKKTIDKAPAAPEAHFSIITGSEIAHTFTFFTATLDYFEMVAGETIFLDGSNMSTKKLCAISYCEGNITDPFDYYLFDQTNSRIAHFIFQGRGPTGHPSIIEFEEILSTFRFVK